MIKIISTSIGIVIGTLYGEYVNNNSKILKGKIEDEVVVIYGTGGGLLGFGLGYLCDKLIK